ncbi:MAG: hypothetical protein LT080_08935 [Thiobacillus sp.]|nr:hypothetical protein [Thiobacillus sp.]
MRNVQAEAQRLGIGANHANAASRHSLRARAAAAAGPNPGKKMLPISRIKKSFFLLRIFTHYVRVQARQVVAVVN